MAKQIKIGTLAGWVYLDDDNKVVEIAGPADAPENATVFRLRPIPVQATIYLGVAVTAAERTEAIAGALKSVVADARGLVDADGDELKYTPDILDAMPVDALTALGGYVMNKFRAKSADDSEARRGNEPSGSSQKPRRSSGTATTGSRTALRATS